MTKKRSSEILADKKTFFQEKFAFFQKKCDFFQKFSENVYKFDLGFSWVFYCPILGFQFFLSGNTVFDYVQNKSVFHVVTSRSQGRNLAEFQLSGNNCVRFSTTETKPGDLALTGPPAIGRCHLLIINATKLIK